MEPLKIRSIDHLKSILSLVSSAEFEFVLGDNFLSRKLMSLEDDGKFYVLNYIDDTEQVLTAEELTDVNVTLIGTAIGSNIFYLVNVTEINDEDIHLVEGVDLTDFL